MEMPVPKSLPDLGGKTALITGATSGFGERFARVLAARGAKVVITGRRQARLNELKEQLVADGGEVLAVPLDVTDEGSISSCLKEVHQAFGSVDILINNAGMNVDRPIIDLATEDYDRIISTNMRSVFLISREVGRQMIDRGYEDAAFGTIINIASMGAHKVLPGLTAYCASKAAVVAMTKGMAREWARYNINVNAICPGYILTEINDEWFSSPAGEKQISKYPRRRLGAVSDLDGVLMLLVSDQARFITGASFDVDDGQAL